MDCMEKETAEKNPLAFLPINLYNVYVFFSLFRIPMQDNA